MPKIKWRAKPGRRVHQKINQWEREYGWQLEVLKKVGEIEWYGFEAISLKLAKGTWYRPDYLVITAEGFLEIHEVKGHMEDDASVKLKVAQQIFPGFTFLLVRKHGNFWDVRPVAGLDDRLVASGESGETGDDGDLDTNENE